MPPEKFPVFRNFLGPVTAPTEVWATKSLGFEEVREVPQLALWIDEVASGVETVRATPAVAHVADGLRRALKGLAVVLPRDRLRPRHVLLAAAHALSLGVELMLTLFPPGPPSPDEGPAPEEGWLRWQFTIPPGDRFLAAARAAVFSLDVTDADYHSLEVGLEAVAADTGGFYAKTHDFPAAAMARLEGALAGHYVLAFEKPSLPAGPHRIEVELVGRRGTVLAPRAWVD